jgi:hypothetical protein
VGDGAALFARLRRRSAAKRQRDFAAKKDSLKIATLALDAAATPLTFGGAATA